MMKVVHRRTFYLLSVGVMALVAALLMQLSGIGFGGRTSPPVAHAADGNLLQNPGFESGRNNWFDFGGSGAQTTSSVVHNGAQSLVMGTGQQGVGQLVTLQPNTYYSISAWGKTSGGSDYSQVTLRVIDGSGNNVDYQMPFGLSDWTRQARTILTPSSVQTGFVYILKNAGSNSFYVDDISVAAGRDAQAWPFSADSIWNTPLGSNARYVAANITPLPQVVEDNFPVTYVEANAPRQNAYTAGYIAGASDFGSCNRDPSKGSVGSPQGTMQVPDSFLLDNWSSNPSNYQTPNDAGIFIQGDARTVAQLQPTFRCNTGGSIFGYRGTDVDLYGQGNAGTHYGTGLSALGGLIRQGELIGPAPINHALQIEIYPQAFETINPAFRWPADRADNGAATVYCTVDPCKSNPSAYASVKAGSLLALPSSATLSNLGLKTTAAKKLFYALQNYGGYITDGSYTWETFGTEDGVSAEMSSHYGYGFNTSSSATGGSLDWFNDIMSIFRALQVIDNNGPSSVGGGGTPLVTNPLPAFANPIPPAHPALDRTGWTASATINSADAANILDGNTSTAWRSGQPYSSTQEQSVTVDLQQPRVFNQVSFDASANYSEFPQNYEIDVSNDGSNWTQVHAGTGSGISLTLATFNTQDARYVKVKLDSGSLNGSQSWTIDELNLYGPQTPVNALSKANWTASASQYSDQAWHAIDGDQTSRWTNGRGQSPGNNDWFEMYLSSPQSFSSISLVSPFSPGDYIRGYQVYVSNDGTNWGNPIAIGQSQYYDTIIAFPPQSASYIKVVETGNSGGWWWSIDEFFVYP